MLTKAAAREVLLGQPIVQKGGSQVDSMPPILSKRHVVKAWQKLNMGTPSTSSVDVK